MKKIMIKIFWLFILLDLNFFDQTSKLILHLLIYTYFLLNWSEIYPENLG